MKKLLQLEFIKYTRSRPFYVFVGLYMVLVVLFDVFAINVATKLKAGMSFGFPGAWTNFTYLASYFNFLMGLLVIISITYEFQYRTFRQHIIDGLNKIDIAVAKYLYAISLALFSCIFVIISVVILATINAGPADSHNIFSGIEVIGKYFIQLLGYMSLAMFIGVLFKNTALAAIFYVLYSWFLEFLVSFAFFHKSTNMYITSYFPKALFSSIVPKPGILTFISSTAGLNANGPSEQTTIILALVYILLFAGGSYWILRSRDL